MSRKAGCARRPRHTAFPARGSAATCGSLEPNSKQSSLKPSDLRFEVRLGSGLAASGDSDERWTHAFALRWLVTKRAILRLLVHARSSVSGRAPTLRAVASCPVLADAAPGSPRLKAEFSSLRRGVGQPNGCLPRRLSRLVLSVQLLLTAQPHRSTALPGGQQVGGTRMSSPSDG